MLYGKNKQTNKLTLKFWGLNISKAHSFLMLHIYFWLASTLFRMVIQDPRLKLSTTSQNCLW